MENGKELWVSFKYEQLSNLCYWCGSLTFDDTNCELWLESEGTLSIESQQFGPWICVAPFMSSQRNFVIVPDFCTRKKDGREAASSTSSRKPPVVVVRMGKPSLEIFRPEKERTKTIQRENISLNFPDEDLRQSMPTPMDCGIFKDSNISKPDSEISEKSTKNFEERIGEIDRELSRYDLSPENILAKNTCTAQVDMAKRAGRVGFGSGQSGHGSKRVIFKRVNRVTGQTGCRLSRVKLTRIFQNFFLK